MEALSLYWSAEAITVDLPVSFFLCVFTRRDVLTACLRLWRSVQPVEK